MQVRENLVAMVLGGAVIAMGCDAQVDADYIGEVLEGNGDGDDPPPEQSAPSEDDLPDTAAAGVIWDLVDPGAHEHGVALGELVEFSGDFPSAVRLLASEPPDPSLLVAMADGNALAVARLQLVESVGFDPRPGGGWAGYGASSEHVLVYVRDDVQPGSATSRFLHGTPAAGYHVFDVDRPALEGACSGSWPLDERGFPRFEGTCPRNALLPSPADLETPVNLRGEDLGIIYEDIETAW